ncbi:MAG: hypothetical protein NZ526_08035 [Aquificaceae bacterium]|nr:hypothetical protein [Aquificaceae bacterium]
MLWKVSEKLEVSDGEKEDRMTITKVYTLPDKRGYFGEFGG